MELYDIVEVVKPFWDFNKDKDPYVGRTAIISEVSRAEYELTFIDDGGSAAWWDEDQLKFIKHGTKEDLDKAEQKFDEIEKLHSDVNWIRDNWNGNLSSISMVTLLEKIGYKSTYSSNGEFGVLFSDFRIFLPVFMCIFDKDLEGAKDKINSIVKPEYVDRFKDSIESLYNEVWS